MVLGATTSWPIAQEQYNNFARQDKSLAAKLQELSEQQTHANKLAWALESGACYGLRSKRYDMLRKKQLNKDLAHPPVEPMW